MKQVLRKGVSLIITTISSLTFALAQSGVESFGLGFSPIAYMGASISASSNSSEEGECSYKFKNYWNTTLSYETRLFGAGASFELTYAGAKFGEYQALGNPLKLKTTPSENENIRIISLAELSGMTLNSDKRLQIPIAYGFIGEHIKGGPFANLMLGLTAKSRVQVYVTDNLAIYAGGFGRFSLGMTRGDDKKRDNYDYSLTLYTFGANVGVFFSF